MEGHTIAMTIVLTSIPNDHSNNVPLVEEVCKAVQEYVDLWARAYEEVLEVNRMRESRRGTTVDDVIPAKIITPK